jgi:hypothetical protein
VCVSGVFCAVIDRRNTDLTYNYIELQLRVQAGLITVTVGSGQGEAFKDSV